MEREEKLQAAKKKLRKYQDKQKKSGSSKNSSALVGSTETSSRSSSVTDITDCVSSVSSDYSVINSEKSLNSHLIDKPDSFSLNNIPEQVNENFSKSNLTFSPNVQYTDSVDGSIYMNPNDPVSSNQIQIDSGKNVMDDLNIRIPSHYRSSSENNVITKPLEDTYMYRNAVNANQLQYNQNYLQGNSSSEILIKNSQSSSCDVSIQDPQFISLVNKFKCELSEKDKVIKELNDRIETLNSNKALDEKRFAELIEQVSVYSRTTEILVSEKSALQTSVHALQQDLRQKNDEIDRMKNSLVGNEDSVRSLRSSNDGLAKEGLVLKRKNSEMAFEITRLSETIDQLNADVGELSQRLSVRSQEKAKIDMELQEMKKRYELAQINIEQLKNTSIDNSLTCSHQDVESTVEELRKQLSQTSQSLLLSNSEKDQNEAQYKIYSTQLVNERDELKNQVKEKSEEISILTSKIEQLESVSNQRPNDSAETSEPLVQMIENLNGENEELQRRINEIRSKKEDIEIQCQNLTRDNGQLSQLLAEAVEKRDTLEAELDRRTTQQVDTTQLVQSMQSDKVAAARALQQNKQLKEQLEELQNALMLMSNKKLEMTEKLESELHQKKFLNKEIAELKQQLFASREELSKNQTEITRLKEPSSNFKAINSQVDFPLTNKDISQNTPVGSDASTEQYPNITPSSNVHLSPSHSEDTSMSRSLPVNSIDVMPSSEVPTNSVCSTTDGQNIDNSHSIDHTEIQRTSDCSEVQKSSEGPLSTESSTTLSTNGDMDTNLKQENSSEADKINRIDNAGYLVDNEGTRIESAYEALERRFLKSMNDVASLSEQKQQLEHLVQQLELETETIGDYITIYQFQRGVMKQQAQELNFQVELLQTEKSAMSLKLSQLQNLVRNLGLLSDVPQGETDVLQSNSIESHVSPEKIDLDKLPLTHSKATECSKLEDSKSTGSNPLPDRTIARANISPSTANELTRSRHSETVNKIKSLISDMEASQSVDITALQKANPCPHCMGALITV